MLTGIVVFGVVSAGVWLLFIFKMRAGRNWARIVLTVLGCLSVLLTLLGLLKGGSSMLMTLVGTVEMILMVVTIVLMFRPGARSYFGQPS